MILLTCDNCDKQLRLRDELAGKRIKCPDCDELLEVPVAGRKPPAAKTPPPKAAKVKKQIVVEDDDEYEDDEDDVRPLTKGKKRGADGKPSAVIFIVGLILAVAGLAATAACIYFSVMASRDADNKDGDRRTKEGDLQNLERMIREAGDQRTREQKAANQQDLDQMTSELDRLTREVNNANSSSTKYMILAVVSGVFFLVGAGLRGYHHIAMKNWMAEHHGVGKKKRRRDDDDDDEDDEDDD